MCLKYIQYGQSFCSRVLYSGFHILCILYMYNKRPQCEKLTMRHPCLQTKRKAFNVAEARIADTGAAQFFDAKKGLSKAEASPKTPKKSARFREHKQELKPISATASKTGPAPAPQIESCCPLLLPTARRHIVGLLSSPCIANSTCVAV